MKGGIRTDKFARDIDIEFSGKYALKDIGAAQKRICAG
jgi:hypothetical protein